METETRKKRPKVSNHHWVEGTLHLYNVSRANLYWTPDPEYSPVLRLLHGGETIEFVPEVKFEHWIVVRLGHQVGWVNLHTVEITENTPPPVEEEPYVAPEPVNAEVFLTRRETRELQSLELDHRLRASLESESIDYELDDDFEQQLTQDLAGLEDIAPPPPPPPDINMSSLKRLIRYVTSIKDALSNS